MSRLTKVSIDSVLYDIGSKGINSYETLSDMSAEPVANLDDGAICWCKEDEKYYQWLSTNEIISVYARWRELNLGGNAIDVEYENTEYPDLTNVGIALDNIIAKIYYVKPSCSLSASPAGGTFEMGTVITAPITFTWTVNKAITSQTLTDCTIELADRTAAYNTDISSDKTFTLSVSDGENSATSSVSYKFLNNVFWGSAPTADTYDSAFISALSSKKLTSSVKGTYSFNVANGEYGFWAVPSNMTISTVWIGGFEVTVEALGTVSYTNAQGYTRDYNLYKTGQSGLGSISAEIK